MSLKKFLKRSEEVMRKNNSGQSFLEYFILLTLIASLTLVATSTLLGSVGHQTERFCNAAAAKIAPDIW